MSMNYDTFAFIPAVYSLPCSVVMYSHWALCPSIGGFERALGIIQ